MSAKHPLRVAVDARPLDIEFLRAQGIGRFAAELIGPLAAVAAERGGELTLLREGRAAPVAAYGRAEAPPGTRVYRLPRLPIPSRVAELPAQLLTPLALRRSGADLYHALSIYRAPLYPGLPSVVTVHDTIPLMWPELYLRTGLVHKVLFRAAKRATRVIAVSECSKRDAVAHLGIEPDRIDVVYEAAEERFTPTDADEVLVRLGIERPYVLYVGGLANDDPRKNVAELIDAFAAWSGAEARPETLVMAGRLGPGGRPAVQRAAQSGARIHFTDFVADADLPALYAGAACLVSASRYEGFGLPALEAIACGTPVAAYDAGAVREVAGPGAILVGDGNPGELMRAVAMLCDDADLRTRLSAKGLQHAAGFSWRKAAQATWAVYEKVAGL